MARVNGACHNDLSSAAIPADVLTANGDQRTAVSPERLQRIRELLCEPFDAGEIKWRVTATSTQQTKHGPQKRGQLIAYADQRAYTDRLNEVFGEWGWTRDYEVNVAQNFERRGPGKTAETAVAAKVVVVSRVTIHGLGSHTGVGEQWADDENAATRAEAQAFKRACACFGLGRYLYDLDMVWVDLDPHNRPTFTPSLPDWAMPHGTRRETRRPAAQNQKQGPRQGLVREELLAKVADLRKTVGYSLSLFVLNNYAGGAAPERIGHAKLTTVFEKLTDISNGIGRLRTAAAAIGEAQYAAICRELNFAGDSVDNIPDRNALRLLVERVEAAAKKLEPGNGGSAQTIDIAEARGQLLQAARKTADRTGKRLADVITEASDGRLSLDALKNLTDEDVPVVAAATSAIGGRG
jgi:hypothetical protein